VAVALVVAAGRGERLGSAGPKTLVDLAGRPMLDWSLAALRAVDAVSEIVVALPPGVPAPDGCVGVAGGEVRSASVRAALAAASPQADVVLVHDGARPLVTPELIEAVLAGLEGVDCAIAAARVSDTVKEADEDAIVLRTLDQVVARAQAMSRRLAEGRPGASVDDFLAERQREADAE